MTIMFIIKIRFLTNKLRKLLFVFFFIIEATSLKITNPDIVKVKKDKEQISSKFIK